MKRNDIQSMSINDLWELRTELGLLLSERLESDKRLLQMRLNEIKSGSGYSLTQNRPRRPYPKVAPKFHNPLEPSQTWAGRGKQPRWLIELLANGKSMDDLRISETA